LKYLLWFYTNYTLITIILLLLYIYSIIVYIGIYLIYLRLLWILTLIINQIPMTMIIGTSLYKLGVGVSWSLRQL
jgi:hypothetical protein